jgi:bifunctional non-homologous end joining protein LigD
MTRISPVGRAGLRFTAARLPGARKATFPGFIQPMKPTLRSKVPAGARWQYEFKLDGWRAQLHRKRGPGTFYSSNGYTLDRLASLATGAASIPADAFVIDGELVMLGDDGLPSFHAVKSATLRDDPHLQFYAFDLLYFGETDLRNVPLAERRRLLEQLIGRAPSKLAPEHTKRELACDDAVKRTI